MKGILKYKICTWNGGRKGKRYQGFKIQRIYTGEITIWLWKVEYCHATKWMEVKLSATCDDSGTRLSSTLS